jgi:hypothetical protein
MMLRIFKKILGPMPYQPRDVIADDVNEKDDLWRSRDDGKRDTVVDKAHRWKLLAENLQRRYSFTRYPAWRRMKEILRRIRSYHRKARDIPEDWVRKASLKKIVMLDKRLGYAVVREDLTGLISSLRRIESKDHRTGLTIMRYRRIGKWIDWLAEKHLCH